MPQTISNRWSAHAHLALRGTVVAVFLAATRVHVVAEQFVIETADGSANNAGYYTSLALDSLGNPHVSYFDITTFDLKYARKSEGIWTRETADESVPDLGQFTSLALDASGNPHVSYLDNTTFDLKYARKVGGAWTREKVDGLANSVGYFTSLVLDAFGNPHITNWDGVDLDLKYAQKSGGAWTIERVDGAASAVGQWTSLALDGAGAPHVSYYDDTNGNLKYAHKSGSVWVIETADGSGDLVGACTSLALDALARPHVSYYNQDTGDLKYAWKAGSVWLAETVDGSGSNVGQYTSLAIDASGNPHVSYFDDTADDLKYARKSEGVWMITTVDGSASSAGLWTSLALDAQGNPHVSYYDATSGNLKYAHIPMPPSVLLGPVVNPANSHSYYLLSESSWQAAQAEAESLGGDLVTIDDAEEQSWVFSTFGSYGGQERSLWIGLNDQSSEGAFVWVSGAPFGYSNWLWDQPDNRLGNENYVHMIRSGIGVPGGSWNDLASPVTPFGQFAPIHGVVEYVPPRSWRVPEEAATIQAAINLAATGDTVLVAPGTYTGPGNKNIDFGGKSLLVRSEAGAASTVIDVQASSVDRARAFDFDKGEPATAVVDGFTIVNGWEGQGGAIRVVNGARPTIRNCMFQSNFADASDNGGGAIFTEVTSPVIQDCVFDGNSAVSPSLYGGAISCFLGGDVLIERCSFTSNSAIRGPAINANSGTIRECSFVGNGPGNEAGALRIWGSCVVEDCVFENNSAELGDGDGGAVWLHPTGNTSFTRCVFLSNSSIRRGGALLVYGRENNATVEVSSCTFHENSTVGPGSAMWLGLYFSTPSVVAIDRTIISAGGPRDPVACEGGSTATLTCCNVTGHVNGDWVGCLAGQNGSSGNFSADPSFCAPAADLTLRPASPCLPGNHPMGTDCGLIGALGEGCSNTPTPVELPRPGSLALRAMPSVVRSATTLIYTLPAQQAGTLEMFDVSGRRIWSRAVKGSGAVTWEASEETGQLVASGTYILRLRSNGAAASTKVSVVR